VQDFPGKDGSSWRKLSTFHMQSGRLQQQNVVNVRPVPTAIATNRVIEGSPSSFFRIIFSEAMLQNIQKQGRNQLIFSGEAK